MGDSMFLEVRVRRFGHWQVAVGLVTVAALAVLTAWAMAMFDSQPPSDRALLPVGAALLALATLAVALSLACVAGGVLSRRDGIWTFAPGTGVVRTGRLEVAIDLGTFLLLHLRDGRRAGTWLPVQRSGLEAEWHALRCAVYAPPIRAVSPPTPAALPAE